MNQNFREIGIFLPKLFQKISTRQKVDQNVIEIGIFNLDPDLHFLRIQIRTGQEHSDPG